MLKEKKNLLKKELIKCRWINYFRLQQWMGCHEHTAKVSDIFVLEEKLNEELREKHLKSIKLRMEIEKKLQNMDNAKEREVLERYYLDGLTWKKVAKKIGYGEAQTYRLRNTALKNFKI